MDNTKVLLGTVVLCVLGILLLVTYGCMPNEIYVPEVSMKSTAEALFEPETASGISREKLYYGVYRVVDFKYDVVCYDKADQPLVCLPIKGE